MAALRLGFRRGIRGVQGTLPTQAWAEITYPLAGTASLAVGWGLLSNRWLAFVPVAFMASGDSASGLARYVSIRRGRAIGWWPSIVMLLARLKLLIIDKLGLVPLSKTGAELLFEVFSRRYERGSVLVTTNLPFDEWTEIFGSERLTGALLDRLTHRGHILEMNGESYRLKQSRKAKAAPINDDGSTSA
jgi:hypothetical protein